MIELWRLFEKSDIINKKDYIAYLLELLFSDRGLKDKLLVIYAKRKEGVYSRELIDFKHNGISFSERAVTQDLKRLKDLGLIRIGEKVGKVIRYTTTPLGTEVIKEFVNNYKK